MFSKATTSPISPRQKDRKQIQCVHRGRFLVRQPEEYPSCRRRCLTRDCFKGGDRGRRIESSHKARITAAQGTSVPPGIVCKETPAAVHSVEEMAQSIPRLAQIDRQFTRTYVECTFSARAMARNYAKVYQRLLATVEERPRALRTHCSERQ
jgi:hypothetical protein